MHSKNLNSVKREIPPLKTFLSNFRLLYDVCFSEIRYIPWPQYRVIVSSFTNQRKSQFTTNMYIRDDITLVRWRPSFTQYSSSDVFVELSSWYWDNAFQPIAILGRNGYLSDSKNLEKKKKKIWCNFTRRWYWLDTRATFKTVSFHYSSE